MYSPTPRPRPEDWARLGSYFGGFAWGASFLLFTPSSYSGVIDYVFVLLWSALVLTGSVIAGIGAVLRRDVKVELPGLYLIMTGTSLYFTAQFGFSSQSGLERIPLSLLLVWHSLLLLPRIIGLEAYRRAVRRAAGIGR